MAIGGLIGIEREKETEDKFAGIRTLTLLCGAAPVMVFYSNISGYPWMVGIYLGLAVLIALAIAYIRFTISGSDVGFTTSVAVFFVALLGVLVGYGEFLVATAVAIIVAFLLAEKQKLLSYIDQLSYKELSDSMMLAALVFIVYPILPTEPVGPYDAINLREILIFAVFVLLIEFSSYISMRQFGGSKGLAVTGVLAGGANSFATAGIMARMANQSKKAIDSASSALLLATVSMIVRNIGLAMVIAVSIIWVIWIPGLVMVGVTLVTVAILWTRSDTHENFEIDFDSPFSFKAAVKFSIVYVLIKLTGVFSQELLGETGLYVTSYAGGLISSAAVAVTAATLVNSGEATVEVAAGMVILGILASLTSKIVLIEFINGEMRWKAAAPMGLTGVAGLAVYFLLYPPF
jgi:uncharacterized membrane protein (DUF4010 family)